MKKLNVGQQIGRLRRAVQRWKAKTLVRRTAPCYVLDVDSPASGSSSRTTPSGCVAVYIGPERRRFVIPTRFLNLPVFVALLDQAEEEFGFPARGGLALPCEVGFFQCILRLLEEDEAKLAGFCLEQFVDMISKTDFDSPRRRFCRESIQFPSESCRAVAPLLEKTKG